MYGRHQNEKWSLGGDSVLSPIHRQDMAWSPHNSTLSASHTMGRRREGSLQSETWPPIQAQSGSRWHGQSHDTPSTSPSSAHGLYQERSRVRSAHPYDDGQMMHRRENDSIQSNSFPLRYTPHPNGTREGALQRLHWQSRDIPDAAREHRRVSTQTNHSFSHSPTMPFNAQGYHSSAPTYTSSWTPTDSSLLTTPTLHSISSSQTSLSYDGTYSSNINPVPLTSSEEFSAVEEYRDS